MPGQPLTFPLDVLAGRQAQVQRRRLQGSEHLLADQVIEGTPGQAGTGRHRATPLVTLTAVAMPAGRAGIEDPHATAAVPAHQQAAEQRRALAGGAQGLPMRPILPESSQVRQVTIPADVGRQAVADQDLPVPLRIRVAMGLRVCEALTIGVAGIETVGISPRVDGMMKDAEEDRA